MQRSYWRVVVMGALVAGFVGGIVAGRAEWGTVARAAGPAPGHLLLTKHEGETFTNQTVYISGQAFVRCKFVACTLVMRESAYHLEGCMFERCNWHLDVLIAWGDPSFTKELKALVAMLEEAQRTQLGR